VLSVSIIIILADPVVWWPRGVVVRVAVIVAISGSSQAFLFRLKTWRWLLVNVVVVFNIILCFMIGRINWLA
jgi:hypothetical protein